MKGKGPKVSFNDVMVHEYVIEPRSSQRISARDDKDGVPHLEVSWGKLLGYSGDMINYQFLRIKQYSKCCCYLRGGFCRVLPIKLVHWFGLVI